MKGAITAPEGAARAIVVGLLLAAATRPALADDVQAGRTKAQPCAVCHGPLGIATAPDAPHLAGQSAIYVAAQLRAYRSGARKHEVMAVLAKPLTDEDIVQIAAWYAAIRVEAVAPAR